MIEQIFIEKAVSAHPRVESIRARFPRAQTVEIDRYPEVFNRHRQNFRLQKRRPALILAEKRQGLVHETPPGYGLGQPQNYYFSHMLNCAYDCRYCFLQGMYRSAAYVVFVNFEEFFGELEKIDKREEAMFFSGYDCDSLAFEAVTGFARDLLPWFRSLERSWLELRTKSVKISELLATEVHPRVVVAYSLSPSAVAEAVEHQAPPVAARLQAIRQLASRGWLVGLRLDPILASPEVEKQYRKLIDDFFAAVPTERVHSVTLGAMRFPQAMYKRIEQLYPDEPLFYPVTSRESIAAYPAELEESLIDRVEALVSDRLPAEKIFRYPPKSVESFKQ